MNRAITWLLATAAALLLAAGPTLMGEPGDMDLVQATADDVAQAIADARVAHQAHRGERP